MRDGIKEEIIAAYNFFSAPKFYMQIRLDKRNHSNSFWKMKRWELNGHIYSAKIISLCNLIEFSINTVNIYL